MRKSKEETAQTRERIVATAAAEFRRNGIVATGIADLMKSAALTNGGFYRHFDSKDQLIAEANQAALSQIMDRMSGAVTGTSGPEALEKIVDIYLSTFHRDNPQQGCVFGALGSELAHADTQTRRVASEGFEEMVDLVAAQIHGVDPAEAKRQAMVSLFTMVGAMTISRIMADEAVSDSMLEIAKEAVVGQSLSHKQ